MKKIRWLIAQFFEKFWWRNYLKNKDAATYLKWKKNYWQTFLQDIQFNTTSLGKKCIDIGCGPAGIFILSETVPSQWTALDPLLKNYENLTIFKPDAYKNVDFVESTFEAFETENCFDTIFCINAINHFIYLEDSLEKLHKILNHKGTLILSTDAHNYRFLKWVLYLLPFDILHPHQYTLAEYNKKIENAGFEIKATKLKKKEFIFSYYIYILQKKTSRQAHS